jgi:transposase
VCFDCFGVAKHLRDAVNDVRKAEHRALLAEGDAGLNRTRFLWLMSPRRRARMPRERRSEFDVL